MASTETISPNQLKRARTALWHQNGDALRTMDDARSWLDEVGLVPYYPHAQFAAAPQPSFAEAVLGRPESGWVPTTTGAISGDDADAANIEDEDDDAEESGEKDDFDDEGEEGSEEDGAFEDDEDEDLNDEEQDDSEEDDDEEEDEESNEAAEDETGDNEIAEPEASDDEVMLSNDDEFAEDEGDEIAEIDRIHAGDDPLPNDLEEGSTTTSGAEEEVVPAPEPINGFSAEEKETVNRTLARLIAEGSAVPLNLLGSTTGEPDFVCSAQAFSFVYTLRGDKGWKQEPSQTGSMRVSPLAVKVHALLKEKGPMAPHELATELAQGIVDSAVLRALSELWAIQRVIPVPDPDGAPAKWELLTGRFVRHLKAGANAGQPTALSALLSLYLSKAVAASSDDMEIFLSPLSARSRVREVVGGLAASRQLDSVVVEGKTLMFMPGALDQLPADKPETSPAYSQRSRYEDDDRRAMIEDRAAKFGAPGGSERKSNYPVRKPAGARAEGERGGRPGGPRFDGARSTSSDRPRSGGFGGQRSGGAPPRREGGFAPRRESSFPPRREGGFAPQRRTGGFGGPREGGFAPRTDDRERRPFVRRDEGAPERSRNEFARPWDNEGGERKPFVPREGGERRPFTPRGDGERRPFTPREGGGERRPFTPRGGGERPPFTPREAGERRPFAPRGDRPFAPRADGERRPFAPRQGGGERRPFVPRGDGERRPFVPREGGERRPFTPRGDRPYTPRKGGERRPFVPREGGERRPFTPRGDSERRPFTPREGGERRPFTPRGDGERRPFTPRPDGERRPFTPRGDSERRPFTPRDGGDRKPFSGPRKPFGADRGGSSEGRPSFPSGAKSSGPGGAKFGGSGFGRDRKGAPGGFGRPGFSPARKGPGYGPGRGGAPKRRPE